MARKLGIDPGTIITETDPNVNAARYAAAIIYQKADDKADAEAQAKSKRK